MHALVWIVSIASILLMLLRPRGIPEWVWVCVGAFALISLRLISLPQAARAIGKGTDVYLFLTGMMLLSELARREGVFDWAAAKAAIRARGSGWRLFLLIYAVGVVVTVFLSNDATAVVLTPAVFAAAHRARVAPLPYLYACAFIANAASFALPISNPANLVIYGSKLPPLAAWFATYAPASFVAVALTLASLWLLFRREVSGRFVPPPQAGLSPSGRIALTGLVASAITLLCCSAFGVELGIPTLAAALFAVSLVAIRDHRVITETARHVAWGVLPLVAGLFVIVEALNSAGALAIAERGLGWCVALPDPLSKLTAGFGVGLLSNLINNLPVGLASAAALQQPNISSTVHHAVLVGVDLGPNLSVTGSLATILWLIALRRDGVEITPWQFLKVGAVVMTPALLGSMLVLR